MWGRQSSWIFSPATEILPPSDRRQQQVCQIYLCTNLSTIKCQNHILVEIQFSPRNISFFVSQIKKSRRKNFPFVASSEYLCPRSSHYRDFFLLQHNIFPRERKTELTVNMLYIWMSPPADKEKLPAWADNSRRASFVASRLGMRKLSQYISGLSKIFNDFERFFSSFLRFLLLSRIQSECVNRRLGRTRSRSLIRLESQLNYELAATNIFLRNSSPSSERAFLFFHSPNPKRQRNPI